MATTSVVISKDHFWVNYRSRLGEGWASLWTGAHRAWGCTTSARLSLACACQGGATPPYQRPEQGQGTMAWVLRGLQLNE